MGACGCTPIPEVYPPPQVVPSPSEQERHRLLGSEAQTFIRQLSARVAGAVPYRLLDEASWATQGCAPLLRSAITFSARRALAAGIRRSTCSGAEAAYVERCDDQPAPDPACVLLRLTARLTRLPLSSDLLRVAACGCLGGGWSVLR